MKPDVRKILDGNQLAGSRLIRLLEEENPQGKEVLKQLYPYTGNAYVIGITGPPGSGKSTLVSCIISEFRKRKKNVAVAAIDPSSPISGGALLGDRIRMRRHTEDKGVFIRSLATRGHLGGLSKTTRETVLVFDAMGYEIVIIETVGVGQDEVEIAQFAHTTAVVTLPGMGDEIQAMKAGLFEIGDVLIVNKADLPGADEIVEQLQTVFRMKPIEENAWRPPVLKTIAAQSEGIVQLVDTFRRHHRYITECSAFSDHNFKLEFGYFQRLVKEMAVEKIFADIGDSPIYLNVIENLKNRRIDPFSAAEQVTEGFRCKL